MRTAFLLILTISALAGETNLVVPSLTIGDRIFTNATIRKVNPKTVIVRDENGFGSMAITNLPEPYRSRFFDSREIQRSEQLGRDAELSERKRELAEAKQNFRRNFVLIGTNVIAKSTIPQMHGTVSYSWQNGAVIRIFDTSDRNNPYGENKSVFVVGVTNAVDDAFIFFQAVKTSVRTKIGTRVYETWDCGKPPP
jgi:hypothetical protein